MSESGSQSRSVIAFLREDLRLCQERSLAAIGLAVRFRVRRRDLFRQCYFAGNRSLVFVAATMGFIGMIMVLQSGYQAARLLGEYSLVGPAFLQLLVREFGPTIGALMITTRIGAGIAAELGSMTVTEQIDALRMCGTDPVEELIVPRLMASMLMIPALIVLCALFSEVAGLVTARVAFGVPYATFFNVRLVTGGDLALGLIKAFVYALVIPLLSAHAGLVATGGSRGVGQATTRAVIHTSVAVIFLDFFLNVALYPLYAR